MPDRQVLVEMLHGKNCYTLKWFVLPKESSPDSGTTLLSFKKALGSLLRWAYIMRCIVLYVRYSSTLAFWIKLTQWQRYLRRFVYSEHYFPNATTDDYLFSQVHAGELCRVAQVEPWIKVPLLTVWIDHCLNLILQSIMCSADTTLINMYWLSGRTVPKYNPVKTPRSCVDWEKLENSLKSRVISHAEIGRLKNPL